MTLKDKITEERRKVNDEISDEQTIAHCHTTINKLEHDFEEFINELKEELDKESIKNNYTTVINRKIVEELIDELSGWS